MAGPTDIFTNISLSLSISPALLWGVFGLLLVVAVLMSTILLYHWSKYGQHILSIGLITTTYLVGIVLLLVLTAGFLGSYTSSL